MRQTLSKASGTYAVIGLAVAAVVGLGVWFVGRSPWLLVCATSLAIAFAVAQRASLPLAAAAGVGAPLAFYAVVVHFSAALPWSLAVTGGLSLALLTAGALAYCLRMGPLRAPAGPFTLAVSVVLAAGPLLVAAVSAVAGRAWFTLEWVMNGDVVWHLLTAGRLVEAGGLVPEIHNPAPMTIALMGMAAAPGRPAGTVGGVLPHDLFRLGEMWILLILLSGVLAALVALRTVRGPRVELRIGAAVVAFLVATSSYFAGFALTFGFFNATPSVVLLLVAWLAWLDAKQTPVVAFAVLALSAVALLATWAPLALLPLGLGAALLVTGPGAAAYGARRRVGGDGGGPAAPGELWRPFVPYVVVAVPVVAYLLGITLVDLNRQGEALVLDGAIQNIGPLHWLFVGGLVVLLAAMVALRERSMHQLVGVGVVGLASVIGLAYMVYQLLAVGRPWRGYYPIKFAWFVCCLLVVLLVVNAVVVLAGRADERRRWPATTNLVAVALAGAIAALVMFQAPVAPLRQQFPLLNILAGTPGVSAPHGARAEYVFDIIARNKPAIAASYVNAEVDQWINMWLLQVHSEVDVDPIRNWAYGLNPQDPAHVCAAIADWDRPVVVYTSNDEFGPVMDRTCGQLIFEVVVQHPLQ